LPDSVLLYRLLLLLLLSAVRLWPEVHSNLTSPED